MSAHISVRPALDVLDENAGCWLVCAQHDLQQAFGMVYRAAKAACLEHNTLLHA